MIEKGPNLGNNDRDINLENNIDNTKGSGSESIANIINKNIKNRLPTENYESTVGVYGGEIVTTEDNKMVYVCKKLKDKIDKWGDKILRKFDDHHIKEPFKLLKRHPGIFFDILLHAEPMRYRGSTEEIAKNAERLGLSEYYGIHPSGIEIKKPEVFTKGIAMGDIFKSNEIDSPFLDSIDRFQALAEETNYIDTIHSKYGAIGDIVDDVIFQDITKDGQVFNPVLNIPDIILNPSKKRIEMVYGSKLDKAKKNKGENLNKEEEENILKETNKYIEKEQKAIDVNELILSSVFSEIRRNPENPEITKIIETIFENYKDTEVLKLANLLMRKGRHTLLDNKKGGILNSFFSMHNMAHLGANKDWNEKVRETVIKDYKDWCEKTEEMITKEND